jgi:LacI family transcriptional regulator
MKNKKATMKDVAELAGVSVSSVSHVINKTRRVEDETKREILNAINNLRYTPNLFARSLKGKGTKLLGVIIADIRDSFFAEVVKSIEFSALENGYNVILCDSENKWEKERIYLDTFIAHRLDGIIYAPSDTNKVYGDLAASNIPFVQIDRKIKAYDADFVGIDNVASSREATENLIKQGCRQIGYIGFSNNVYTSKDRLKGWKDALAAHAIRHETLELQLPYHDTGSDGNLGKYLADHPEIDGLICCNNNCCYEAILEVEKTGKKIPDDVKIVTYDDTKWFDFLKYPISVIVQPTEAIGRIAVECVVERIAKRSDRIRKDIILSTEFIQRK